VSEATPLKEHDAVVLLETVTLGDYCLTAGMRGKVVRACCENRAEVEFYFQRRWITATLDRYRLEKE
jgi:hypothetical protein